MLSLQSTAALLCFKNDDKITYLKPIFKRINKLRFFCYLNLVSKNGLLLENVPEEFITNDINLTAVKQNPQSLKYVLEKFKTLELCSLAVTMCPHNIVYVPLNFITPTMQLTCTMTPNHIMFIDDNYRTQQMWSDIIEVYPEFFKNIPYKLNNYEICKTAVTLNGSLIKHVPSIFLTDELYLLSVKEYGNVIKIAPEHLKNNKEFCINAVKDNGTMLKFVPNNIIDEEICMEAVKEHTYAITYVPKNMLTLDICFQCVKNLRLIPCTMRTPEIYIAAVKAAPHQISDIPIDFITEEMCKEIILYDSTLFSFIPDKFKTDDFCKFALSKNHTILHSMPKSFITEYICLKYCKHGLHNIPYNFKTYNVCLKSVSINYINIHYVPKKILCNKIYEIVLDGMLTADTICTVAVNLIPRHYMTPFLWKKLVHRHPFLISRVPEHILTYEMCIDATHINYHVLSVVPIKYKTEQLYKLVALQRGSLNMVPDKYKTKNLCSLLLKQNKNNFTLIPYNILTDEMFMDAF